MPSVISDLLTSMEVAAGLAAGAAAVVVGATWKLVTRRPLPVGGTVLAATIVAALTVLGARSIAAVVGLILLATSARVTGRPVWAIAACLPGALVLGRAAVGRHQPLWVLMTLAIIAGALGLSSAESRFRRQGLGWPLLAITWLAAWITVPETETIVVGTAALLVAGALGWTFRLIELGPVGGRLLVGLLAWSVGTGAATRPVAAMCGMAALALLLAEPAVRLVRRPTFVEHLAAGGGWGTATALAAQTATALLAGRVAGLAESTVGAAAIAISTLAAAAIWAGLPGKTPPDPSVP